MIILTRNLYLKYLTSFLSFPKVQLFAKNYSQVITQLKMNEAILFHEEGSKDFKMTFRYVNSVLNVDRQFNFQRQVDESINYFIQRIHKNISSYLLKIIYKKRKKNNEISIKLDENEIKFIKNHSILNGDLTCKSILENSTDIKLVIFDTEYILKQNVPYISKIEIPIYLLVGFPIYPSKFEGTNINKVNSVFIWYVKKNKQWIHVGEGFFYVPTISDIGCQLKISCIPKNNTECGPSIEIISNSIVQIGPNLCPFDVRHAFTKNKLRNKNFRVTSYNILANVYSETSFSKDILYPYCPHYALSMDYRKLLILKEIIGYNSDIICLQEVDATIYKNDLQISLSALNYNSVYNLKNDLKEGLAIFYNQEKFDKLSHDYSVISQGINNLNEFNTVWSQIQDVSTKQTFLNRNTIIQLIVLRSKENDEILIVGNTHLYFRLKANHIRLLQAYYGLLYLHTFSKKIKKENPECNVSILYCGDFNSTPQSAVYQLMTQNYVTNDHSDWISDSQEHVQNISIKHDLNLASACGIPEYTNYTATFSGCLDYIFYQTDYLAVKQVIPMPNKEELKIHTGLPSIVSPSDHIALCVDLKWLK
ncbi:2',5'-phosphodiesterase 12 [Apis mellifera]|uniref:2',5'-phosphodiesterase 12 n=1 Tax=Apis mellifera TaxID=7460 RepID=A0A7M7MNC8_APIME|nr:2',5'-phosphodiesterase 12 [Apis mellifera]|eukprot:XP_026298460.1 2',5'-phosphodiesterase 12 [Apis mellifera]